MNRSWLLSDTGRFWLVVLIILVVGPISSQLRDRVLDRWYQHAWEQSRPRLVADLRTLDPLLHALEKYRLDHPLVGTQWWVLRAYPPNLEALVPTYLQALPTPPPRLAKMAYEVVASHHPGSSGNAELRLELRPQSVWRGVLGLEPRGTLLYRGVNARGFPGGDPKLWGNPAERVAGWDYYPARRRSGQRLERIGDVHDPRQAVLRPYREERLKALAPIVKAYEGYRDERRMRGEYPGSPPSLEALIPRYLKALPQLPPGFGPLHYEYDKGHGWMWVMLREQVSSVSGEPLDLSGGFSYNGDGGSFSILLDKSDPNSRPLRPVGGSISGWSVYE